MSMMDKLNDIHEHVRKIHLENAQLQARVEAYERVLEDVINTEWPVSVNIKDMCRATLRTHKGESHD